MNTVLSRESGATDHYSTVASWAHFCQKNFFNIIRYVIPGKLFSVFQTNLVHKFCRCINFDSFAHAVYIFSLPCSLQLDVKVMKRSKHFI